jgi:hypothetical protein
MKQDLARRIGLIVEIVNEAASPIGRTALMKLLYFVSTVKKVDVGYNFTLYSYGPFDSTVLSDVEYASEIDAVRSTIVQYPNGYGYELAPGPQAAQAVKWDKAFVQSVRPSVKWAVASFGKMPAADLELASTIVFAERRLRKQNPKVSQTTLVTKVREIKPRFTEAHIVKQIESLKSKHVIKTFAIS